MSSGYEASYAPWVFLKTVAESAGNSWGLTAGCTQGKRQSKRSLTKPVSFQGESMHVQGCAPETLQAQHRRDGNRLH